MEYSVLFFSLLSTILQLTYQREHSHVSSKREEWMNPITNSPFLYWGFQNPLNGVSRVALLKVEDQWNNFTNFVRISFDFSSFFSSTYAEQPSAFFNLKKEADYTTRSVCSSLCVDCRNFFCDVKMSHLSNFNCSTFAFNFFFASTTLTLTHFTLLYFDFGWIFCTHCESEMKHPNPISSGNFISAMIDRWNNFPSKIQKNCMQQKSPQRH